jgi:hypothetical protein
LVLVGRLRRQCGGMKKPLNSEDISDGKPQGGERRTARR